MKKMNYEAPVAEMIEMQASMVLMSSGGGEPGGNNSGSGTGSSIDEGGTF